MINVAGPTPVAHFGDHIVRLLTSDETAHRVAAAGHQTAMRILDVRTSLATMASALNESKALRNIN
jgi:hypothetical protein